VLIPVSQTQASEEISCAGMDIVGWYHSHPSFAPNPSIRDIETQLKFQVYTIEYHLCLVKYLCVVVCFKHLTTHFTEKVTIFV